MKGRFGVGVDVGGTFAKIVAVAPGGKVLETLQIPTEVAWGPRSFVRRTAEAVRALERRLGRRAAALGLGAAGDLDAARGRLRFAPNLRDFEGYPLRDALARALGRPCVVENDANMAAWGAYVVELGRRHPDVLALTMGTGIGGGIVLGGRLHSGATGTAGEFGHMTVVPGGALCSCGARGCLEAYAGRRAVARQARELLAANPRRRSPLRVLARRLDPRDVSEAARFGDPLAREVWRAVGLALGRGIANLVLAFNPDAVVLTGGVSRAGALFMPALEAELRRNPFRAPFSHARVVVGRVENIGAVGAGLLALEPRRPR
ncbi:MAG: ROK family protein [Elusimicrobiota bacterium]|jgi:glucokinase